MERSFDFRARSGYCFRVRAVSLEQLRNALEAHGWRPDNGLAEALWHTDGLKCTCYAEQGEGQEVTA